MKQMPLLVTAAVIFNAGKVLITKRPTGKRYAGLWEFPGGKVDPGESPEDALRREIQEELDAEILIVGIFEVAYHQYDWGPVLILAYECQLKTDMLRCLDVAEHRWVHPSDLLRMPLLPADQAIINRLNQ